ncbi:MULTISPECIES: hypothetical protein [Streptococcaceae]|uniref:hypothetical protein n=1 Tax=Pseudolactococcus carnosus TaxID=2749961 RepID=UPI000BD65EA7|nr:MULTISPECIES: hypothetical protein [Lactococcus]SOB47917.1 hypothetical protein LPICM17_480010 [Lactococcus piscium]MDN5409432.1 hypothetical protein [Lactococcus sp.]MDN5465630.1 hypothetical protein [Lactococcus sp.]MDN5966455.1 hypothetical protein [Lactococcus sp.]MDN6208385.1 hypothetical protein [Lactococcus sp.]
MLILIWKRSHCIYYIDKPDQDYLYSSYVADELVAFTRKIFPLSHNKEDTFIGGLWRLD